MNLWEILFWLFIIIVSSRLIWELIPDYAKEYWRYQRNLRRDKKTGQKRKYIFTWKR